MRVRDIWTVYRSDHQLVFISLTLVLAAGCCIAGAVGFAHDTAWAMTVVLAAIVIGTLGGVVNLLYLVELHRRMRDDR